ncbi:MAG: class I SAM-dependent methyltransferase [Candidatus Buchananbacteria bacterium]
MLVTVYLIILLIIALVALFLAVTFLTSLFITGVPFISSAKKDFRNAIKVADLKSGELLCDLGCGRAHHLIYANKKVGAKCIGYELSLWPYLLAKLNIWLAKADVKVYYKNFFKADLSKVDVVYCYLFPEIMDKLEPKFKKELKPGARVVSYGFRMQHVTPQKAVITHEDNVELGKIYLYKY